MALSGEVSLAIQISQLKKDIVQGSSSNVVANSFSIYFGSGVGYSDRQTLVGQLLSLLRVFKEKQTFLNAATPENVIVHCRADGGGARDEITLVEQVSNTWSAPSTQTVALLISSGFISSSQGASHFYDVGFGMLVDKLLEETKTAYNIPYPATSSFFSLTGDNAGDGTIVNPWETFAFATNNANTPEPGNVVALNGTYPITVFLNSADTQSIWGQTQGGVIFQGTNPLTGVRVMFIGTNNLSGVGPITYGYFTLDANGRTSSCLDIGSTAVVDGVFLENITFKGATGIFLLNSMQRNFQTIRDCLFEGPFPLGAFSGTSWAQDGAQFVTLTFNTFTGDVTGGQALITGQEDSSPIGAGLFYTISKNTVDVNKTVVGSFNIIQGKSAGVMSISGNNVNLTSPTTGDVYGIIASGISGASLLDVVVIENNVVTYDHIEGYCISLGTSQGGDAGFITSGVVRNNVVANEFFPANSPHGFCVGKDADGLVIEDNISYRSFVGILASKTTSATIQDNLVVDCYGPSLYAKGCTAVTFSNNEIVVSSDVTQRTFGIMHCNEQDGVTGVGTFDGNEVWVQDFDEVQALAGNTTGNVATFTNNTFYIPADVPANSNLFIINSAFVSESTWLAAHPVGNVINRVSQATIDAKVAQVKAQVAAAL